MTATDEQIAAWLDGSLSVAEAAQMEALMAQSPALAARAERLREMDELVRRAIPVEESLPADLLARLGLPTPAQDAHESASSAAIIDLAAARSVRAEANRAAVIPGQSAALRRITVFTGGWRVAAQVLLVVGLGASAAHWLDRPASGPVSAPVDPAYHVLGDAPSPDTAAAASANALILFAEPTDGTAARTVVARVGAQIVGQPTQTGAWRLKVDPARRDQALAQLRALPQVRMAEPIDGPTP